MENTKKTTITPTALILILTMATLMASIQTATAQTNTMPTYPFLGVVPNPVGVGQTVLLHVGIFMQTPAAQYGWENLSITIERPDGQTETISGIRTDSTGGTGVTYTPTMAGVYRLQAHFPEQLYPATLDYGGLYVPEGTVMLASDSEVVELVVQEEPIEYYPDNPLPSEYWSRPIDAQLRTWSAVTGNWLNAAETAPKVVSGNSEAPETAHILWAKPLTMGGLAGATDTYAPNWAFSHGDAYEGKWTSRLIINGILIYCHRTTDLPRYYTAVNLRTGEELWKKVFLDNRTIAFGQNLVWSGYNHHGVYPYLWVTKGSDWYAFDPYTGEWEFTVKNVPSGTTLTDENGWLYRVNLDASTGKGYVWSMTHLIIPFGENSPRPGSWIPARFIYEPYYHVFDAAAIDDDTGELTEDAQRAYIAEFTFDVDKCPGVELTGRSSVIRAMALGDKIFGLKYGPTAFGPTEINTWAISLEEGHEGEILFSKTWATPAEWIEGQVQIEFNTISLEEGVAVIWAKDLLQYYAFSTDTGEYLWGPTEGEFYMNYYGWTELGERPVLIWDGKLYSSGCGGIIYCYDLTDGSILWTYAADDPYQEYLFANDWWQFFLWIVDGKLYSAHLEHSAIQPLPRGAPFLCLDATTGDVIFRADGLFRQTRWGGRAIIGDSVIVGMDTYDNRLYAIGKGASEITVSIQNNVITKGSSALIDGRVTDVSPGTKDPALQIRFPKGVPAVADESMSEWMLYVYKQFERPADVKGVTVKLEAVDPNGEYQYLGTTTSDSYGNYGFDFKPDVEGKWMIIATFEGSKSYYPSTATTYLTVGPAPAAPPAPAEPEEAPAYTTTDLAILAAVVIAIIIGAVNFYTLRKQRK